MDFRVSERDFKYDILEKPKDKQSDDTIAKTIYRKLEEEVRETTAK